MPCLALNLAPMGLSSGTSMGAKTIEMVIPSVFNGDDTMHVVITFEGEESFKVGSVVLIFM